MNTESEWVNPKNLPAATPLERLQEWISLIRIIFNVSGDRSDLTYDLLSQRHVMGDDSLFINLGYWEHATTLDEASKELAMHVAHKAQLSPSDKILDVGFGFGDQDFHWCQSLGLNQLYGINISPVQVATAQQRAKQLGLGGQVTFQQGNAVNTDFPDNTFDKVIALECAFHFCTRVNFFKEANRVLQPGGRLTTADFIARDGCPKGIKQNIASVLGRNAWQIPKYNLCSVNEYHQQLEDAGFTNITIEFISDKVFDAFTKYQRIRLDSENFKTRYHPLIRTVAKIQIDWGFLETLDYIVVTAEKTAKVDSHE